MGPIWVGIRGLGVVGFNGLGFIGPKGVRVGGLGLGTLRVQVPK